MSVKQALANIEKARGQLNTKDIELAKANLDEAVDVILAALEAEAGSDPRELGGDIAGPGGPDDEGQVVIDARRAIMVDELQIAKIEEGARGQLGFSLLFGGRINQTDERAKVMLVEPLDGLASIVVEIHGVAKRAGVWDEFQSACEERWNKLNPVVSLRDD